MVLTGPPGVGKTAMLDVSAELGTRLGFEVVRTSPPPGQPGRLIWAQLLWDAGADDETATALLGDPDPLTVDAAARQLISVRPRLILVDDIDRGGLDCIGLMAVLAPRLTGAPMAVLASALTSTGVGRELHLKPLSEQDLGLLMDDLSAATRRAVWIASRGLPGAARSLASDLRALRSNQDPVVHVALNTVSRVEFLEVDVTVVRLLETALERARDERTRARLLARLSAELLGEASAAARRRSLADEALELARRGGDAEILAEVLDARLSALWDPGGAEDRLAAGSEIVDLAQAAGDGARERHGLFWRFVALMELGRVAEAESALAAFAREAALAGDIEAGVMVTARHAMLAILRGRFDEAERLAGEAVDHARAVRLPDAENLRGALAASIAVERDPTKLRELVEGMLATLQRRLPGHFYEATAARALAILDRLPEAATELERVLPRVLAGSGPRWLGAMSDLAFAAAAVGNTSAAASIYDAIGPYRGRLVVFSGASHVWGPVSHYLGVLATALGRYDEAVVHLGEAIAVEEQIGALPYLAHSLAALASALEGRGGSGDAEAAAAGRERARSIAERLGMTVLLRQLGPPGDEWALRREGEDWLLEAGSERARLRDARGLHYLRMLVSSPGRDISALELVSGGGGLVASEPDPVVDQAGLAAYRRRLVVLEGELDSADAAGDATRALQAEHERDALLGELRRATGLGGRPRHTSPEAERARVNVTRTLRATIERIEPMAPKAAAHLRASVRTGLACRYDPVPGGPERWRV